ALEALHHGGNPEQVLQQFAHRLTQKLIHPTSMLLREAAKAESPDYFEWLQQHLQDVFDHERKPKR
ncbi:glutamyl-tRNA reductase, partial [Acinetobacter baumannii]